MEEEQLYRNGMIKDQKRRFIYLKDDKAYQIMEKELSKVSAYSSRKLYSLLVFLILFGVFKQSFVMVFLVSLSIYLAFEIYFNRVFLKNRNTVKVKDNDLSFINSVEAKKIDQTDRLNEAILSLLVIVLIYSVKAQLGFSNNLSFNDVMMYLAMLVLAFNTVRKFVEYFKHRSDMKKQ